MARRCVDHGPLPEIGDRGTLENAHRGGGHRPGGHVSHRDTESDGEGTVDIAKEAPEEEQDGHLDEEMNEGVCDRQEIDGLFPVSVTSKRLAQ